MSAETNSSEEIVNQAGQEPVSEETKETATEAATEQPAGATSDLSVEELQKKLADTEKKSGEYLEGWQRARADYENLSRRTKTERVTLEAAARERLLLKVLPVVDDFERALASMPENLKGESWINGVNMIEKKLKTLLEQENVTEIPAQGQEFNPHLHEAVQRDDDGEGDKDVVTAVFQKGYKLGDKVIRAAVVKVGRQ